MSTSRTMIALLMFGVMACGSDDAQRGHGDDDDEPPPPPVKSLTGLAGVWVTEISAFQGVKVPVMLNGAPASGSVPIVAGRTALFRLYLGTDASYTGGPVTARMWVGDAPQPFEITNPSVYPSSEGDLNSTFNFEVGGAALAANTTYRIEIGQLVDGEPAAPAFGYPPTAGGKEPLAVTPVGAQLKIQLVPIVYGADGSDRVPDTSEPHLAKIRDRFFSLYPAPLIDLTVHAPFQHNQNVSPGGNGWSYLLQRIADLRQSDGAPPDVYYHGLFDPAPSFNSFCGGGCVTGLGMQGQPGDTYTRASIGVGFQEVASDTAVHEVGHAHGRGHAPCMTFDNDPGYPYAGGVIGVWGYDLVAHTLYAPETADFMGYCDPRWVSDYTFGALIQRMKLVNGASFTFPESQLDRVYERVLVHASGEVEVLPDIQLHTPPLGEAVPVRVGSAPEVVAQRYRFDHLDDQMVIWPATGLLRTSDELRVGSSVLKY